MWRVRIARLDGDRVVFDSAEGLALPGDLAFGIESPPGLCSDGKESSVKSVELFAGAGGLALGTAEAGLCHKVVIEWDDNACRTLRRNHDDGVKHVRDWKVVECDVRAYDFLQHRGEVSFVSGGPPCQPFSIGGKHRGQDDNRNMFPQAIRAVREIRPLAFMFENIRGLLRDSFSKYFGYIVHQLRYPTITPTGDEEWTNHLARLERLHTVGEKPDLHYNVVCQIVNVADWGVPSAGDAYSSLGFVHKWASKFRTPARFLLQRPLIMQNIFSHRVLQSLYESARKVLDAGGSAELLRQGA